MSEATLPVFKDTPIFTDPTAAATLEYSDPNAVVLTPGAPVQMQGTNQTITTAANEDPSVPVQLVVNGLGNAVNLGTGAAQVSVVGGGAIVEAVQLLNENGEPVADFGKVVKLGDDSVAFNGGVVNLDAQVAGSDAGGPKETISAAAGGIDPGFNPSPNEAIAGFAFYTHGGTGDDTIVGSGLNDFIRGGGGDDAISAGAGNDLIRGGTGSDVLTTGQGNDTLYYTLDQIGSNDVDRVTDFTSGIDQIILESRTIQAALSADRTSIVFTRTDTGAQTTLLSQGGSLFQQTDINFLL